jgi:predicted metal-dependent phosphoesterase TrpH
MIDLHIHTIYSDGTDTPLEILQKAEALKLSQVAITDHNCVAGAIEGAELAKNFDFDYLIGCELSCDHNGKEVHLLGYFDKEQRDFSALDDFVRKSENEKHRQHREIIKKLNALGFDLSYEELVAKFPNVARNRVHIARLMIDKGYAGSVAEVFDKYVTKGKPCFVKKSSPSLGEGIAAIHGCNGLAVLAHFYQYKKQDIISFLQEKISELDGIEAYHPSHSEEQTETLLKTAQDYGKLITGGSDYHGTVKPHISLGCANVPNKYSVTINN